jgi:peptidyl-prolyl cis-trans isomerase C
VIAVNGREISEEEIARETQYHPAATLEEARHEAVVALVIRELLLQEAAALGIEAAPGDPPGDLAPGLAPDEQVIERLLEREVAIPQADDEVCRRYYESNVERFRSPDIYEASHILFPAHPDDAVAREVARAAAEATLRELERDPQAFERLAKERSADTATAEQGGHLGQITPGQTTPELEACLAELEPGRISPAPVATRFGYHLLRLHRRERGRTLPYAMARERVEEHLTMHAWTTAVRQYVRILAGRAQITGVALDGAVTPLVQ